MVTADFEEESRFKAVFTEPDNPIPPRPDPGADCDPDDALFIATYNIMAELDWTAKRRSWRGLTREAGRVGSCYKLATPVAVHPTEASHSSARRRKRRMLTDYAR